MSFHWLNPNWIWSLNCNWISNRSSSACKWWDFGYRRTPPERSKLIAIQS